MTKPLVRDYMSKKVKYLPSDITVKRAVDILMESESHTFPVVDKDKKLVGFITAKRLLRYIKKPSMRIKNIINQSPVLLHPDVPLESAERIMFRYGLRKLPVVDDEQHLVGIITHTDISRSNIERTTPRKVNMIKKMLEDEHGLNVELRHYIVPIKSLYPTQNVIHADELDGRKYEIQKGLAEPIIVIKKKDYFVLVDGHHRVVAALQLGIPELMAHVLEIDSDIELGMEKTARNMGLKNLNDIEITDHRCHPSIEIRTKVLKTRGKDF
ncbi:MAG: hypothetical protein MSIBF_06710 [Candidatus Altiarchaeales archaeon IMC4]|nr:MAG: hypothetical protein MSIBF_06710 [Candidatus Altiarchaeales archaeon IMC4]